MTTQAEARELAQRFGVRMGDENGDTHDEELYCLGLDDIIELKEALAQSKERLPNMSEINRTIAYSAAATLHELGYEWKDGGWIAQQKEPEQEPVAKAMTAHRAAYFMERFKHEEKLLGPNEQAALDFVISMLEAQPEQEPVATKFPMTLTCTKCGAVDHGFLDVEFDQPPNRKPLSPEEIEQCCYEADSRATDHPQTWKWTEAFARAIEAAHDIKE